MHLTAHTDYALRVLMYAALIAPRTTTIDEIAGRYGLSRNHLMKIVQRLGAGGYLQTLRGRGGGIRLGRPAESISLGEVVRLTEERFDLVECHDEAHNRCVISSDCLLRGVMDSAADAFMAVLDGKTLRDVIANEAPLMRQLKFTPSERAARVAAR
jgi:Rrf2 family transcriptional regulator, nitric oxide-sensitive transcriptional repressor